MKLLASVSSPFSFPSFSGKTSVFSSRIMTASWFPDITSETIFFVVSKIFFISSSSSKTPIFFGSIPAISNIASTYFLGRPKVLPSHFAEPRSVVFRSVRSSKDRLNISSPLSGGCTYCNPTLNFLCLTSMECCNARIFISLLHNKIFPSPKNSPTRTNSFPNPSKKKYAILSAPICSIFFSFNLRRSLRSL